MPYDVVPNIAAQFLQGLMQGKQYKNQRGQQAWERKRQETQDAEAKAYQDAQIANMQADNERQAKAQRLQEAIALTTGWSPTDVTSFIASGGVPLTDPNFATKLAELSQKRTVPGAMATRQITQFPQTAQIPEGFPRLPTTNVAATNETLNPMPWDFMNQQQSFSPDMFNPLAPQVINNYPVTTEQYQKPDTTIPGWKPQGQKAEDAFTKQIQSIDKQTLVSHAALLKQVGLGEVPAQDANSAIDSWNQLRATAGLIPLNKVSGNTGAKSTAQIGKIGAETSYIEGAKTGLTEAQTADVAMKTKLRPDQLKLQQDQLKWKRYYQDADIAVKRARVALASANKTSGTQNAGMTTNQLATRSTALANSSIDIQKQIAKLMTDPYTKQPYDIVPPKFQIAIDKLESKNKEIETLQSAINNSLAAAMGDGSAVTPINPFKGEGGVSAVPTTKFKPSTSKALSESASNQISNGVSKAQWITTIRKAHPGYSASELGKIYNAAR